MSADRTARAHGSVLRALLWKEWREQRWRAGLGLFVLGSISFSLVRAQLVTTADSVALVFGVLGPLYAVFLTMGGVATEREDDTWRYFAGLPIRTATILRVKWFVGAVSLLVVLLTSAAAMHVAAESRRAFSFGLSPDSGILHRGNVHDPGRSPLSIWSAGAAEDLADNAARGLGLSLLVENAGPNSAAWLWIVAGSATFALLSLHTASFVLSVRARTELHAGLSALLFAILALAWMAQYALLADSRFEFSETTRHVLWMSGLLNPLSPFAFLIDSVGRQLLAVVVCGTIWIALPLTLLGWRHVHGD